MSSLKTKDIYKDQRGIISILVVTILTVTLSLIAIGFSRLADRELRQASDRESAAQAYYAAQSGINDAVAYLAAGNTTPIDGCVPQAAVSSYFKQDLSGGSGAAKYSCISVDPTPEWLSRTVTPGKPQLLKIHASGLKNLFIAWENARYAGTPQWLPGSGKLPPEDSVPADTTGVLRVGLYDAPPGDTNNDALSTLSRVYYLYSNSGGGNAGTTDYSSGCYKVDTGLGCRGANSNGKLVDGNCDNSNPKPNPGGSSQADLHYCNSEIQNLPSPTDTYYLYLTAQYAPLSVTIQGQTGSGTNVSFDSSQATVDVTGQGSGVIQRVRATVNLGSRFDLPNYAVQSMESICKNFSIDVTGGGGYGSTRTTDIYNYDTACSAPGGGGSIIGGGTGGH